MSSTCGVPGCRHPKFTSDGNKNYKCFYWKRSARKKALEISIKLEENVELQAIAEKDIPVRDSYVDTFFKARTLDDINVLNEHYSYDKPWSSQIHSCQDPSGILHSRYSNLPGTIENDKLDCSNLLGVLSKQDLFDSQATRQVRELQKILTTLLPVSFNSAILIKHLQDDKSNSDLIEVLAKIMAIDKALTFTKASVDKIVERVDKLDMKVFGYKPENDSSQNQSLKTLQNMIKYSKFLNRRIKFKNNSVNSSRGFLFTRDPSLISYLFKLYPGVFEICDGLNYEKDTTYNGIERIVEKDPDAIWILPEINFIGNKFIDGDYFNCLTVLNESDGYIPKDFDLKYIDNNQWIEFFIMAKFSFNVDYFYNVFSKLDYKVSYQRRLQDFLLLHRLD